MSRKSVSPRWAMQVCGQSHTDAFMYRYTRTHTVYGRCRFVGVRNSMHTKVCMEFLCYTVGEFSYISSVCVLMYQLCLRSLSCISSVCNRCKFLPSGTPAAGARAVREAKEREPEKVEILKHISPIGVSHIHIEFLLYTIELILYVCSICILVFYRFPCMCI